MHIDIETALKIVMLNNIRCCALCAHYETYEHDLGREWYCNGIDDKELDNEPYINVFKSNECESYQSSCH